MGINLTASLSALFGDVVVIERHSDEDVFGAGTYDPPVSYTAHVDFSQKERRDADGRTLTENGRVYLKGAVDVSVRDRLTLPNGDQPVIGTVQTRHDEQGEHHTVLGLR